MVSTGRFESYRAPMGLVGLSGSHASACAKYTGRSDEIPGGRVGQVAPKLCTRSSSNMCKGYTGWVQSLVSYFDVMKTIELFQIPS